MSNTKREIKSGSIEAMSLNRVDLAENPQAPKTEFKLFNKGITETTKGKFLFDKQAEDFVMTSYKDYGNQLSIDYNHMVEEAAGWGDLEVRDGELWATKIEWTKRALAHFADREYRFYSPTFMPELDNQGMPIIQDDGSIRVASMFNVALTNVPATKHQDPLILNKDSNMSETNEKKDLADAPADAPADETTTETVSTASDVLPALEDMKKQLAFGDTEKVAALLDALITQITDDAAAADDTTDAPADTSKTEPTKTENSQLSVQAENVQLSKDPAINDLTVQLNKANQELKAFKDAAELKEKTDLVNDLVKLGKITPVTKEKFLALSVDWLKDFSQIAPVLANSKEHKEPEIKPESINVTPELEQKLKKLGLSKEQAIKYNPKVI